MTSRKSEDKRRARDFVWEYKSSSQCSCGESHPAALTFHHIDPDRKRHSISWMIRQGFSVQEIVEEIQKCQIVCSNCHLKLHYGERIGVA